MAETYIDVEGEPFRISSPDKLMFPDQGWTKLDVVAHYVMCLPGALQGVRDRPTMLKRWNSGVADDPFYHKRANPKEAFDTVEIRFPSQRPGLMRVPRAGVDVVRMAQLNCLDLNPWPVRASDIDHPDELRVDLDPTPDSSFAEVREVAAIVRDILSEHGLTGWPKTSGNRGIHIYARIEPRWTFHEARRCGLALAREAERRHGRATTAWWKEERSGVFLDYNQMARDKTIASVYSIRQTGLVSTPFEWDELDGIEPKAFDLVSFRTRWKSAGDLTEHMDDTAGSLESLLELVAIDESNGIGDAPWPPHYPKQPGEPPRVQPSKRKMKE
ncbi:MAG: ATP-dependent DNA ligase [Acidimicrobiia bacterium]